MSRATNVNFNVHCLHSPKFFLLKPSIVLKVSTISPVIIMHDGTRVDNSNRVCCHWGRFASNWRNVLRSEQSKLKSPSLLLQLAYQDACSSSSCYCLSHPRFKPELNHQIILSSYNKHHRHTIHEELGCICIVQGGQQYRKPYRAKYLLKVRHTRGNIPFSFQTHTYSIEFKYTFPSF